MTNYDQFIEALKDKDEETFEYIYNETKHAVYAMIVSIIKDKTESQDLMQDTYITMLEKIDQYKIGKSFLNWLLVIARNKAIDYYRRKKHEVLVDISESDDLLPVTSPIGERSALVNEMLDNLTEIERSVFLLRIIQNFKNREIAKILNLPLGTVLWHQSKAMKKIKNIRGGEGNETKKQD